MSDKTHPALKHQQSWGSPGYTDRHKIKQLISELWHSFARKPSDEITDTWAEQLKDYSAGEVEEACNVLIRTTDRMPVLSNLLQAIRKKHDDGVTPEEREFLKLLEKQRKDHKLKRDETISQHDEDFLNKLTKWWCVLSMGKEFTSFLPKDFSYKDFEYVALIDWYRSNGNKDRFIQLARGDL